MYMILMMLGRLKYIAEHKYLSLVHSEDEVAIE
jgi:hypothetical protein